MKRLCKYVLLINLLTIFFTIPSVQAANDHPKVAVHYLDVGQADCIFIEVYGGKNLLIDAGDNHDGGTIVDFLEKLGVEKIDYLVATHPHHDHIGGLDDIIENFKIGKIYASKVTHDTSSFYEVVAAVKKHKVKVSIAKDGKKVKLGHGVNAELLVPMLNKYVSINDKSIIVKLVNGNNTFLFMSDAGIPVEKKLLLKKKKIKATVLKIGHHGADSASTDPFIKKVRPDIAVISVGRNNSYHYPSKSVLKTLKKRGVTVLRTDQLGTISAISNGDKIVWFTSKLGYIYP
jgi:competence protein ComEC